MIKYRKKNPRLTIQFVNADNDDILFQVPNRNWTNVGDFLTDYYVDEMIKRNCKRLGIDTPPNVLVIVAAEFNLKK